MLASVEGLDSTSADRTITLNLLRAKREVPKFSYRRLESQFVNLRDSLYVLALSNHQEVARIYESQEIVPGLRDREDELWSPILALAEFFDSIRLERDPGLPEEDLLGGKMIRLALLCRDQKQQEEVDENPEQRILLGVLDFVKTAQPILEGMDKTDFFVAEQVLEHLHQRGLENLKKNGLTRTLFKLQVLRDRRTDKKTLRVDLQTNRKDRSNGSQCICYRLDPARLKDVGERYLPAVDDVLKETPQNV